MVVHHSALSSHGLRATEKKHAACLPVPTTHETNAFICQDFAGEFLHQGCRASLYSPSGVDWAC